MLYENQQGIDTGWVNEENLRKFASQIPGLNIEQFNSCFGTQKYKEFIDKDVELANSKGFFDTPNFIIGTEHRRFRSRGDKRSTTFSCISISDRQKVR